MTKKGKERAISKIHFISYGTQVTTMWYRNKILLRILDDADADNTRGYNTILRFYFSEAKINFKFLINIAYTSLRGVVVILIWSKGNTYLAYLPTVFYRCSIKQYTRRPLLYT